MIKMHPNFRSVQMRVSVLKMVICSNSFLGLRWLIKAHMPPRRILGFYLLSNHFPKSSPQFLSITGSEMRNNSETLLIRTWHGNQVLLQQLFTCVYYLNFLRLKEFSKHIHLVREIQVSLRQHMSP